MKQLFWVWCLIILLITGFVLYHTRLASEPKKILSPVQKITPSPTKMPVTSMKTSLLFVPYWTVANSGDTSAYDTLIYFGVTPNQDGINTKEDGYTYLDTFVRLAGNKKKLLTIRMVDQDINAKVLQDPALQQKIIDQSIQIAEDKKFDGIVLDLEYSALSFESVVQNVTNFSKKFATGVHDKNLVFYQTMYGDAFYRGRPFDVEEIGKNSDGLLVMAYDLHKANGEAGPNFPLQNSEYDIKTMIQDFLKKVPSNKITVVFGMFGYDWKINNKGLSLSSAESLSSSEIKHKFLTICPFKNCFLTRDSQATEQKITYTDNQGIPHIMWFEDKISVEKKEQFLLQQGINSKAYWAYTYF